jgi:hypothetical protein
MELCKKILLALEASDEWWASESFTIEGYGPNTVRGHIRLLQDAAFVEILRTGPPPWIIATMRLTWAGHEFIDAARDQTRWDQARGIVARIGGATIDLLGKILAELAWRAAKDALPT